MSTQAWMNHLLWATHAAIVAAIASLVNREVPEPYMVSASRSEKAPQVRSPQLEMLVLHQDEIFHIGQAKTYCAGRWLQWDPKLTTPPGLSVASL